MRPFNHLLQELEDGVLVRDLSVAVEQIITAVRDTRKAGSLTIKIAFTPASKPHEDVTRIDIEATVTPKLPQLERGSTLMFLDDRGTPTRRDPYQSQLDLQEVPAPEIHFGETIK